MALLWSWLQNVQTPARLCDVCDPQQASFFSAACFKAFFMAERVGSQTTKAKNSLIIDFAPLKGSRLGELTAKFDIIMGFTPEA